MTPRLVSYFKRATDRFVSRGGMFSVWSIIILENNSWVSRRGVKINNRDSIGKRNNTWNPERV